MRSGSRTGSPRLILSTFSMPSVTLPQTVYCLSRKRASSKTMKNCELAEFGAVGARHGADAAHMGLGVELGLQVRQVGAAGAGAVRAAGLRHEALDHAVEGNAVIKALAGQSLDALHMAGSEIGTEFDDDLPLVVSRTSVFSGSAIGISYLGDVLIGVMPVHIGLSVAETKDENAACYRAPSFSVKGSGRQRAKASRTERVKASRRPGSRRDREKVILGWSEHLAVAPEATRSVISSPE